MRYESKMGTLKMYWGLSIRRAEQEKKKGRKV